eukprot:scaffold13478_cov132-Cylindrotheca_fusiformis.AAC.3
MSNNSNLERRKAVADALSGVAGSLVSLWTFYPIEVVKSNLQVGSSTVTNAGSLFKGCRAKTLHTASSSFCYFFFYSWIFAKWKQRHHIKRHEIHPGARLFLSALAAIMNTLVTLPLDVLSSKQLTEVDIDKEESDGRMDQAWTQLDDEESLSEFKDSFSEVCQEERKETRQISMIPTNPPKLQHFSSFESLDIASVFRKYSDSGAFHKYTGLWKGIVPALLLCSNPSIHYTAFDLAKTRILNRRERKELSMSEAFLVGLFAKFIATVATYPLIRAKVILMVTSEKSLIATLCTSYKNDGVKGLYKGCDWQLLHTVLKSALMMMVRERISHSSRRLVVGDSAAAISKNG